MANSFLSEPHPLLKEPVLYAADVPERVKWEQLETLVACCGVVRSGGRSPVSGTIHNKWKLLFYEIFNGACKVKG